ncbi:MAG: aminopeptidase P family protein [Clostridia bacterium]|nr:aminopeptidase P family protein [Clostridia bacterium]
MTDSGARIARLQAELRAKGWRAAFVAPGDDLRYLAGFSTTADERPAFLAVTPDDAAWLMPALNREQAAAHSPLPMFAYTDEEGPGVALSALLAALRLDASGEGPLGVNDDMRADFLLLLQRAVPGGPWSPAGEIIGPLRMIKDAGEIERMERVAALTDRVLDRAFAAVRPGVTERELQRVVEQAFADEGADEMTFCIVGSGPNSAYPHHHTSARAVQAGEPVMFDIGGRKDGYCSDITRMVFVGEPHEEYLKVHAAVEAAVQAAFAAARPGAPLRAVDEAARKAIDAAGYGPYFVHRTGHGLGVSVHEPPSVHGRNETIIREGMVFTIEPGIYLPGRFGVRLEEVAVVERDGARRLSGRTRDAVVVPDGA